MKKIIALTVVIAGFLQGSNMIAADDVYDAPVKRKVKQTYSEPSQTYPAPAEIERTAPYIEEGSTTARGSSFGDNTTDYRVSNENYYSDDYSGSSFGYTDRIQRFHNPSIQFNYGWNNWNNNYYDPWNTYNNQFGWNNWNNYSFTPSWTYGYNNFYNPFWNTSAIVIIQPGFNSWYNTGFNNPWNNWGWSSWNNYNYGYGFSPYCSNAIFNNGFSNYGGYYDYNRKNVVYTPRTGTYGNSSVSTGTRNYNSSGSSNTNSGGWNVKNNTNSNTGSNATNNNSGNTKNNKWSNSNSNTNSTNNSGWSNPYKNSNNNNNNSNYNTQPSNNNSNWNNSNSNSNSNSSGIKIGSRPK